MHKEVPQMEYFFCDTHKELQETYYYLDRIQARLCIKIHYLSANRGFDHLLDLHGGMLPSPQMRWCTSMMKIKPFESFVGDDDAISYIGIRADEDRDGYISTKPNIKPVFPFKERGLVKADILQILEDSGIGTPDYYRWRSRSGCFFCFYQRKYEWVMLAQEHPDLFEQAIAYCQEILAQVDQNHINDAELETAIGNLVFTENGARGFFVTFLTANDFPLADQPTPPILNALQTAPAIVGELLVKNLAMSAAMVVHHQRNQDPQAAQGSEQVCQRSQTLIQSLQLPGVAEKLADLEQSLDGEGSYKTFLTRWGYDNEQKQAIRAVLPSLLNKA